MDKPVRNIIHTSSFNGNVEGFDRIPIPRAYAWGLHTAFVQAPSVSAGTVRLWRTLQRGRLGASRHQYQKLWQREWGRMSSCLGGCQTCREAAYQTGRMASCPTHLSSCTFLAYWRMGF